MKISQLTPHPKNPRTITSAKLAQLKRTLVEFGDLSGVVYNKKTGHLVGGHQRVQQFASVVSTDITLSKSYKTPTKTGTVAEGYISFEGERFSYREVEWDKHREKAANLAANKGAGEWDLPQLGEWLKELGSFDVDFDLDLTMFDGDELAEITGTEVSAHTRMNATTGVDEDDFGEGSPEPCAALGDVWVLGRHRLMCGDATDAGSVKRLLKGEKIDMVFTDPPYNVAYKNGARPKPGKNKFPVIENDEMSADDFKDFLFRAMTSAFEACGANASLYCCYASRMSVAAIEACTRSGWGFSQQVIWKKPMLLGRSRYQWAHEPIIFAAKGSPYFTGDRTKTTVWDFGGYDKSSNVHPTQKPVIVPEEAVRNSSEAEANVLDLFGGSGSTLIACEKTDRKCFMMEIDPRYVDVILHRWEKYTGNKAKRVLTAGTKLKKTAKPSLNRHAENNEAS